MYTDSHSVDADFDALSYSYEKPRPTKEILSLAERSLWCAVIEQAFIDAGLIATVREAAKNENPVKWNLRDQESALRWLLRDKENFTFVCTLAGVSPAVIRNAAICMI